MRRPRLAAFRATIWGLALTLGASARDAAPSDGPTSSTSPRAAPTTTLGELRAPPAQAPGGVVVFVDADDEDDDGVPDARRISSAPRSAEVQWLSPMPGGPGRLKAIHGAALAVISGVDRFSERRPPPEPLDLGGLGLQGLSPGRASLELDAGTLEARVYQLMAYDTEGRRVDIVSSHASLSRTLPRSLLPEEERARPETDALRWLLVGPANGMPAQLEMVSNAADGRRLDGLQSISLTPTPCPAELGASQTCRASRFIRATTDQLDRSHPRAQELSLHAEVGGRLIFYSEGRKAGSIRVGGPRQSRLGPLGRFRGRLRVTLLRTGAGGGVALGNDEAEGLDVVRSEIEKANALWGQCGIHFGPPEQIDVRVADPPPPHLLAVGCGLGLPASGGRVAVKVAERKLEIALPPGATPDEAAARIAQEVERAGFSAWLSANPQTRFAAHPVVDVLVRDRKGAYVALNVVQPSRDPDATLSICLGTVNLSDGLNHFADSDSASGSLEERTLLKALSDDDPATIEVLIVPYFVTVGRIGESFVDASGLGVHNAIIIDRAGVRAGGRSFALSHEIGHVLLQMSGHPDDFGADHPELLMDADAADATIFGPRRLSVSECERALIQSGPRAPLPLLERWPLSSPSAATELPLDP